MNIDKFNQLFSSKYLFFLLYKKNVFYSYIHNATASYSTIPIFGIVELLNNQQSYASQCELSSIVVLPKNYELVLSLLKEQLNENTS